MVAGNHAYIQTHLPCGRYRGGHIFARGIEQRQKPKESPLPILAGTCDTQRTEAASSQSVNSLFDTLCGFGLGPDKIDHDLRRTLRGAEYLA